MRLRPVVPGLRTFPLSAAKPDGGRTQWSTPAVRSQGTGPHRSNQSAGSTTVKSHSLLRRLFGSTAPGQTPSRAALGNARRAISLCQALISERGEVSGAHLAREALAAYESLDERANALFFDSLVEQFSPDPETVGRSAERYRNEPSQTNLVLLQQAAEPPRQELFRRLNMAPRGTRVLVEMHRKLLNGLAEHPPWLGVHADFVHLLRSWFNRGFLSLQRIDWRTSASVLEKLIDYEAVHPIQGWHDLRRRLEADRRCYAFFHPALPDEPLIFIEVALTRGMSATVQPLLDPASQIGNPASADCAMFYSITNCQQGLRGVSFGNFLIKQVAEDLGRELPRIRTFATISPIPGFRHWLEAQASDLKDGPERSKVVSLLSALDGDGWFRDGALSAKLQSELVPLCAHYLLHAEGIEEPPDSVSRFHLVNGARLDRINWLADTSPVGLRQSAGMMVNYVYRLGEVERNHEAYVRDRTIVAARRLRLLAKQSSIALVGHAATVGKPPTAGEPVATEPVPSQ